MQVNDLFSTLLNSSSKYITSGIQSIGNKRVFAEESSKILALTFQFPDLEQLKDELRKARKNVLYYEKFPFSFTVSYKHYKTLAYDNAIDILDSLTRRFVTGDGSNYVYIKQDLKMTVV